MNDVPRQDTPQLPEFGRIGFTQSITFPIQGHPVETIYHIMMHVKTAEWV